MNEFETRLFMVCGLVLALGGGPAVGQEPLGDEFQVNERTELTQDSQRVVAAADGSFAVVWVDTRDDTIPYTPVIARRFYDADGQPLGDESYSNNETGEYRHSPFVTLLPGGGFRLFSISYDLEQLRALLLERYSPSGDLLSDPVSVPPPDQVMAITSVVAAPHGRTVLSWLISQEHEADQFKTAKISPKGQSLWGGITVAADPQVRLSSGDIGVDSLGNAVAVWGGECESSTAGRCDVFAQRLSPAGARLGDAIRVNTKRKGLQESARVAVALDGAYLVTWVSVPLFPEASPVDLFGQFFSPTGARVGRELRVNSTLPDFQWQQDLAADPKGNYVVVWSSFRREGGFYGWDILGQLFHHDGRRVGKELRINQRNTFNEFPQPQVAFGGNGTFVVAWNANDGDADGVFARRFAASPGDELCLLRGADLLCDLGRSGGEPEIPLASYTGQLLFGDADRDGQEDPCVFTAGRFDCDTDRRGEPFETRLRFGRAGDIPLFGDVDGDGRQEPCVRRGRFHICDTGHDGGSPESGFGVGQPGDTPLLGDLDGDGRDDACVFVPPGRFLCDLRHDGREDFVLDFGRPDDFPLLMDFDADGDDDPCVFRAGHLLCDTAHDGGEPEADLAFGESGDRLLAGNLDGL